MSKPIVAVVGRPNVGKSTLFNKLTGQRLAIVEDTPGVTPDRIYAPCEWLGQEFMPVSYTHLPGCLPIYRQCQFVLFPSAGLHLPQ